MYGSRCLHLKGLIGLIDATSTFQETPGLGKPWNCCILHLDPVKHDMIAHPNQLRARRNAQRLLGAPWVGEVRHKFLWERCSEIFWNLWFLDSSRFLEYVAAPMQCNDSWLCKKQTCRCSSWYFYFELFPKKRTKLPNGRWWREEPPRPVARGPMPQPS